MVLVLPLVAASVGEPSTNLCGEIELDMIVASIFLEKLLKLFFGRGRGGSFSFALLPMGPSTSWSHVPQLQLGTLKSIVLLSMHIGVSAFPLPC